MIQQTVKIASKKDFGLFLAMKMGLFVPGLDATPAFS
jgi:hypothetical protein